MGQVVTTGASKILFKHRCFRLKLVFIICYYYHFTFGACKNIIGVELFQKNIISFFNKSSIVALQLQFLKKYNLQIKIVLHLLLLKFVSIFYRFIITKNCLFCCCFPELKSKRKIKVILDG